VHVQVSPLGNASATVAPMMSSPPLFVAAIVYVSESPAVTEVTPSLTVIRRSADVGTTAQLSGSTTTVANGVSTTPVNAILSMLQPAAPRLASLPARNRIITVLPGATARVNEVWTVPAELWT